MIATDQPGRDCAQCSRLAAFRQANRQALPDFFNAPVPSFGDLRARLLIVGLAPGLRGANRTGRPFTGDYAGDLLYATLGKFGFATGSYDKRPDDGLMLQDCRITNAVRCVPPQNRPETAEIASCLPFLKAEFAKLSRLRIVLALGGIAHGAVLTSRGLRKSRYRFAHGQFHDLGDGLTLADSYHCSRYNTNTRRLTEDMFESVFASIRERLD